MWYCFKNIHANRIYLPLLWERKSFFHHVLINSSFSQARQKNIQDCCWHTILRWWIVINPAVKLCCGCYTRQAPHTLPNVYCLDFTQLSKSFFFIFITSAVHRDVQNGMKTLDQHHPPKPDAQISSVLKVSQETEWVSECVSVCVLFTSHSSSTSFQMCYRWPGWSNQPQSNAATLVLV